MEIELTNTDHAILTLLTDEPCTKTELVEFTGESSERIGDRLALLVAHGSLRKTDEAPPRYEVVEDPR